MCSFWAGWAGATGSNASIAGDRESRSRAKLLSMRLKTIVNNIIIYDLDIIIYDLDADLTNTNCSQRGRFRPPPPKKGLCERSHLEYKENLPSSISSVN